MKKKEVKVEFGGSLILLTLLFITLKLTGLVAWSWFWVLLPASIVFSILLFALGIALVALIFTGVFFIVFGAAALKNGVKSVQK